MTFYLQLYLQFIIILETWNKKQNYCTHDYKFDYCTGTVKLIYIHEEKWEKNHTNLDLDKI